MSFASLLDPRRHLAAAIGWSMLAVVALASLVAGGLAATEAEGAARAATARLLTQFATQSAYGLNLHLENRLSILQTTAAQVADAADKSAEALRRHLRAVRAEFPEFRWLAVADADGAIVAASGDGVPVSAAPWFAAGREEARLQLQTADAPAAPRVLAAVPIRRADGALLGVLGAELAWEWIERLPSALLGALETKRPLQLFVVDRAGIVRVGPDAWRGRTLRARDELVEGGAFIVGDHAGPPGRDDGLGWHIAVRQPAEAALAAVRALRRTVFATVLAAGLLAALAAFALTQWLTRRLAGLAAQAAAVRQGQRAGIAVPPGQDEVSRIGATISELVAHLQREKAALAQLNAELDARVAERTARIERMAEEARHAAVARERLRLARDLHDTLAHSLMALLAQLRLLRKLKDRLPAADFDAELARAEEVAAGGLAQARGAIAQLRHGTVREQGLAAALRDLLARFRERTGIEATLQAQGWAADLADERAETLYRIAEEALRNVERHARAGHVRVHIADAEETPAAGPDAAPRALLIVRDDGVGFDPALPRPGHYGLLGIREQAELIGAELSVHSAPGAGTELRLRFAA